MAVFVGIRRRKDVADEMQLSGHRRARFRRPYANMAGEAKEEFLEFETAMRDFSTMFPSISREQIERVLRANDGDVAKTIDDLLLISLEATQISTPTSTSCRSQSAPSTAKAVHFESSARRSTDDAACSTRPGILRVSRLSAEEVSRERARIEKMKRENERRLDVVCDEKEARQMSCILYSTIFRLLEDEQLALLMQNKEFIRWLRREQYPCTSYSSYPVTAHRHRKRSSHAKHDHGPRVPEGPVVDELIINAEPDLKDRLKNVSKVSKERLLQLAARFRRSNDAHLNAF
ncbi:CUE domain protein [Oesophagostomum dentatum]|uniref:CUE domain protein n=1 Tax=Oesophagostomum dentatum TaxID=61180 RepID=A0A0B1T5I4_OESDE|nr:CUE domain protein [Oesophagostomum dentatum]